MTLKLNKKSFFNFYHSYTGISLVDLKNQIYLLDQIYNKEKRKILISDEKNFFEIDEKNKKIIKICPNEHETAKYLTQDIILINKKSSFSEKIKKISLFKRKKSKFSKIFDYHLITNFELIYFDSILRLILESKYSNCKSIDLYNLAIIDINNKSDIKKRHYVINEKIKQKIIDKLSTKQEIDQIKINDSDIEYIFDHTNNFRINNQYYQNSIFIKKEQDLLIYIQKNSFFLKNLKNNLIQNLEKIIPLEIQWPFLIYYNKSECSIIDLRDHKKYRFKKKILKEIVNILRLKKSISDYIKIKEEDIDIYSIELKLGGLFDRYSIFLLLKSNDCEFLTADRDSITLGEKEKLKKQLVKEYKKNMIKKIVFKKNKKKIL